jgi:hypothetical protein
MSRGGTCPLAAAPRRPGRIHPHDTNASQATAGTDCPCRQPGKSGARMRPKQAFSPRFFRDSARGFPGHDSVWMPLLRSRLPLPLASMIGETGICFIDASGHLGMVNQLLDQPDSGGRLAGPANKIRRVRFDFACEPPTLVITTDGMRQRKETRRILRSTKTKMSFCTRLEAPINDSQNLRFNGYLCMAQQKRKLNVYSSNFV